MRVNFTKLQFILGCPVARVALPAAAGLILCAGSLEAQTPAAAAPAAQTAPAAQAATPVPTPPPTFLVSFKDGKSIAATRFVRSGANIVATIQASNAATELTYPVTTIDKISFPEPGQIESCTQLVLQGKSDQAIAGIDKTIGYYDSFRDIAGNWWAPSVLVKLKALQELHRDSAADALIDELAKAAAPNSEAARLAGVLQASIVARDGHPEKALPVYEEAINASKDNETLGYAWANKAAALYDLQKYEPALMAYLHVSVFYPDVELVMPEVLLASAKCFARIDDKHLPDAQQSFNDVIQKFPGTKEAIAAQAELKKIVKPQEATASPTPAPAAQQPPQDNNTANSTAAPGPSPSAAPSTQ